MKINPKAPWFVAPPPEPAIDFTLPENMSKSLLACPRCGYQPMIIDGFPCRCPNCDFLLSNPSEMVPDESESWKQNPLWYWTCPNCNEKVRTAFFPYDCPFCFTSLLTGSK